MNLKNGDDQAAASFFKVLLNDTVDYLLLPTAFAQKYMEKGNSVKKQTLVLNPKSGVKWSVKYLKIEDKHYLMDGWLKFMKDNHLQNYDFLVFWLLSAGSRMSTFQVFLYAPDGSLKHPINTSSSSPHLPSIIPTTDRRRPLLVEKVTAEPEVMPDGKKRCLKEKSSNDDDDDDNEDDDDDSLQKVPKSIMIRKSHLRQLQMTKGYWKANGLDGYDCVWLETDEGKMWKVKVSKYGKYKCPRLMRGWKEFVKGNKVKMGNIIEITHVKGDMLHVHVTKGKKGRTIKKKRSN